jgi:FKBP-type peptidyl-prolyl cis-trans isomerase
MLKLSPFISFIVLVLASMKLQAQENVAAGVASPESYLVGLDIGRNLAENGFEPSDFDVKDFIRGMTDALSKAKPAISDEQMATAGEAIRVRLTNRAEKAVKGNLDRATVFLAENAKKDGVQTLKSGLQYKILKKGDGKSPGQTSTVKVHYEGKLIDGTIFDSSIKRNDPATFGVNQVIKGWTEALQRMAVGDKWMLFIPPDLAYGERGSPGAIGPNEALVFEVELLDIVK